MSKFKVGDILIRIDTSKVLREVLKVGNDHYDLQDPEGYILEDLSKNYVENTYRLKGKLSELLYYEN